jgi:DNA-binding transcriptional LysR family regulator
MSLRQLRYFVAVAEAGSFTAAAQQLHVSQPALGLQIKLLEERLEVGLLARHSRGVTLTDAGKLFLSRAKPALEALDEAERAVADFRKRQIAHVSLGLTPSASEALAADVLLECNAPGSMLHLTLRQGASPDFWKMMIERALDFAVCYGPEPDDALEIVPLYRENLFLVGPPDQVETGRGTIEINALADYPLVLSDSKHALRRAIEACAAANGVHLNIVMEMELVTLKREILLRTGRCSISPVGLLAGDIERGRLGARPIEPTIGVPLCLLAHANSDPLPRDTLAAILRTIIGRRLQEGMLGWQQLDA